MEELPPSTVEMPTTESVFALCAAAAEELYGGTHVLISYVHSVVLFEYRR